MLLLAVGIGPEEFGPVDGGHDHFFDLLGDAVRLFDVRADGHVDVDVDVLRLVLGEELHLRREDAEEDERPEQQTDHAVEEEPGFGTAQGKSEDAFIHVFQGGEQPVLEPGGGWSEGVPVDQAHHASQDEEVAQGVQSRTEQQQAQDDEDARGDEQPADVHLGFLDAHVQAGQHGVDDERHEQRGRQHDDQRERQILHELADDARPDGQRQEGSERGGRGGNDGPSDFTHTVAGRVERRHALVHQSIDVLDDHDAIVHQHAECQDQGEEHHHIEGDAQRVEDGEAEEHGQRDGDPDEQGVPQSEEEQEHADHKQDPEDDAVLQFIDLRPRLVRLVGRDADVEVVRQEVRLCFGDDAVDLVGGDDQVFSGALAHVEGHHRVAPFAGEAGGFLIDELNRRHIPQVDGVAPFGLDDDGLELFGITEVADHLDRAAAAVHEDVAAGNGHVLLSNGLRNVIEADEHGLGAEVVDFDLHLLLVDPADFGLVDLVEVLDAVLQFFRVVLELVDGVVAGEVHLHHGDELGEVEVEDVGVAGEVVGEAGVAHGDVHFVLHLPECDFRGHGEIELDVNRAVALLARGEDDVDAGDAL